VKTPRGFRLDPFADARMGRSLFDMAPEDWLVRDEQRPSDPEEGAPAACHHVRRATSNSRIQQENARDD